MKFSKRIIALVGAAAMIMPLVACSDSDSSESSDDTVELTVWAWDSTLEYTIDAFEEENPNITVEITNAGTNTTEYEALNNALQAGSGAPDIAQIEYYALPQYVIQGQVMDLSDYGASDYSDFYTPGTWSSVNIQNGIWALPLDSGPMAWFYNKDVFDEAGVDPEEIRTWDDFYEAAKAIRETGSYITSDSGDAGFFDSMTWLAGATPFSTSDDGTSVSINLTDDENVQNFIDFWQKLIDEDLIDTTTAGWSDEWNRALNDGSIASLLTGAWMPANLLSGAPDGEGSWRVALMPTYDGSETNAENGGSSLAIIATDDEAKAEAAYKFIDYVCHDSDGVATRVDAGAFPADNETLESEDFLSMTSITDSDGEEHEYFGGQEFNRVLAEAAADVSTGYEFLPFEVNARNTYADYAGGAFTDQSITLEEGIADWETSLKEYAEQQGYTVE